MQAEAPELVDLGRETEATKHLLEASEVEIPRGREATEDDLLLKDLNFLQRRIWPHPEERSPCGRSYHSAAEDRLHVHADLHATLGAILTCTRDA